MFLLTKVYELNDSYVIAIIFIHFLNYYNNTNTLLILLIIYNTNIVRLFKIPLKLFNNNL